MLCRGHGFLVLLLCQINKTGPALLYNKNVALFIRQHQKIALPMPGLTTLPYISRSFPNGNTVFDPVHRPGGLTVPSAFALAARQVMPPAIILGPGYLSVYETVYRLCAYRPFTLSQSQPPCNLFRRPSHRKPTENLFLQLRMPHQTRTPPPPRPGQIVRIGRSIAPPRVPS